MPEELRPFPDDPDLHETPLADGDTDGGSDSDDDQDGDTNLETQAGDQDSDADGDAGGEAGDGDGDADADAEGDTKEDTQDGSDNDNDDDDDFQTALEEAGLAKRISSPVQLVQEFAEKQKAITLTQMDNAALKSENAQIREILTELAANRGEGAPAKPAAPELTPEESIKLLESDPDAWFKRQAEKHGYVRADALEEQDGRLSAVEVSTRVGSVVKAVRSEPELEAVAAHLEQHGLDPKAVKFPAGECALWDKMNEIFAATPSMGQMGMVNAIPILVRTAKAELGSGGDKTPAGKKPAGKKPESKVTKVPRTRKEAARTAGTRAPAGNDDEPDFNDPKWTADKIKAWHDKHGGFGKRAG